jgi:hypothetical protein
VDDGMAAAVPARAMMTRSPLLIWEESHGMV